MVINSRSGSHQVLLRQLQQGIHTVDQEEGEEEEEEENPEEENLEEEEEAAAQISTPDPNVAAGGGVGGGEEEEEEEDLFGQIACANPELLQQSPIQVRGSSQGLGRDDWGDGATLALLQAWGDKCVALNKWHLRLDHWAELAAAVTIRSHSPKTDVQCKNRVDTLKKKFKQERQKQSSLGSPSKWPFYRILDRLLGMASNAKNSTATTTTPRSSLPIGADAGNIVKNTGKESKPRPSKRQHYHPSSSEEEEEEEGNDDDLDEELQDHEEQEDLLWVLNFKTKKRGGGNAAKKKKKRKMGSPSSSSSSSSPLAGAIAKLGEIFERMEECKRQQLVDLEKIRMQFTKDLELHRMQLLMQAQMELAKIKHSVDIQ